MSAEAQQTRDDAGAAADRVGMTRLLLTDFRNYREVRLTVGTAPVVLTGPNGAGKTNLLEAISLLVPGRGMRGAALSEHIRKGPAPVGPLWAVSAVVQRGGESHDIGTGLEASGSSTTAEPVIHCAFGNLRLAKRSVAQLVVCWGRSRYTEVFDEIQKEITSGAGSSMSVREGPELLERLNLMRTVFEMREQSPK